MKKYNTKNSAIDLTDLALGIVVLGIVVSIGATILINMRNSQITNAGTYSVNGESVTPTDAGVTLSTTWGKSVDFCQNSTTGPVIPAVNYTTTVNSETGVITLKNLTNIQGANAWKCNYTVYNISDPRYALADDASVGIAEYGNWFKIIVIVGVAAVVLSLIFMAFGRNNAANAGVSY
jgi:hypothetical protein